MAAVLSFVRVRYRKLEVGTQELATDDKPSNGR